MVAIYVRWILAEKITIDDVPARWRKQVEEKLAELEAPEEIPEEAQ